MSNQFIELALNQLGTPREQALLALADQLLRLTCEHIPETSSLKVSAARQRIEGWRQSLQQEPDAAALVTLSRHIVSDSQVMLDRIRSEAATREAEFIDLVKTLRDVLDSLRGDASRFDAAMARSADVMEKAVDIQDLRELKKVLTRELHTFKTTLVERQQTEAKISERLTHRVQMLEHNLKQARAEAATDALTGIPNRGAFETALRDWLAAAAKDGRPFTLGMVDLDDFKKINDAHGHQIGDRVLIAAAQLLTGSVESDEHVSRYGGEEFAILMRTPVVARAKARLTEVLEKISPAYEYEAGGERRYVTFAFSSGVTEWVAGDTPESIVKRSDEALYEAKRRGKRRVESRTRSFLRALVR